ncbi:MAG: hypothetical protein IIV23_09980, partial [Ruminococcus sp.]|nr:hypothetical protein [Ruminococcus sp.]
MAKANDPNNTERTDSKTVTIPKLGHDWEFKGFTWTEAGSGYAAVANYECKNDGEHKQTGEATVTPET